MEPTINIYHVLTLQKYYLMTFCAGFSNFGYQILRGFWYLFLIGTIPKLILRHLWTVSASFFEALSLKTEISWAPVLHCAPHSYIRSYIENHQYFVVLEQFAVF